MREEEQALQHLIERCDIKIATHIGLIIGIIFGSFTILGFLRGAGELIMAEPIGHLNVWYLIIIEVLSVIPIYHSVYRAVHYSAMVEILKDRSTILRDLESYAFERALRGMPVGRSFIELHKGEKARKIILFIAHVILISWIALLYAVLTLPN